MIEKFEECPKCSAHGKDWNYDGQICAVCEKQKKQMDTKKARQIIVQTPPIPESLIILALKDSRDDFAKRFHESENIRYEMQKKMQEMQDEISLLRGILETPTSPQPVDLEGLKKEALDEFMKGRERSEDLRYIAFEIISETFNWVEMKGYFSIKPEPVDLELLSDEWLGKIGFKWSQEEHQLTKHWLLTLGWGAENTRACIEDLCIELASGAMNDEWFCWIRRGTRFSDNFIHLRGLKYQQELEEIITALTGTKFKPENCLYGNFYNDKIAEKLRKEYQSILRKETPDE